MVTGATLNIPTGTATVAGVSYNQASGITNVNGGTLVLTASPLNLAGGVLESASDRSASAQAIVDFNDKLVQDPRVVCVLTTIRDGVTLIRHAG